MNQENYQKAQKVKQFFADYAEQFGGEVTQEIADLVQGCMGIEISVITFDASLEELQEFVNLLPSIDHLHITSSGDGEYVRIRALVDGVWETEKTV
ncbi:MAG: hypothetical protein LUE21_09215 [Oscillospiraceae bacterium]|nr:hypothetical protein [Oscillospiraceae bacterium]